MIVLSSCGHKSNSVSKKKFPARKQCLSIVSGNPTKDYLSVTVIFGTEITELGMCTGTFVSDSTMITAAHCVDDSDTGNIQAMMDRCDENRTDSIKSLKVWHHGKTKSDFQDGFIDSELANIDVAVLKFPDGTASHFSSVHQGDFPSTEEALVSVGFGSTSPFTSAFDGNFENITKIQGSAILDVEPNESSKSLVAKVNKTPNQLTKGDSGGPLLDNGQILGIASLGSSSVSYWSSLRSAENQALLKRAVAEGAVINGL